MNYEVLMKRAIKLALRGNGLVSPNPKVGALIVKDGEVIAEGWHKEFGGDHAEAAAVKNAPAGAAEGSVLIVNLEPCSHYGKTPPCADMIIEQKFSEVVIGMSDPNPEVAGKGIQKLIDAGIKVTTGVLEAECKWVNRFFTKFITTGLPYVIVKVAQSLDGSIATARGESKWITCEESRKRSHALRAETDAVLVGKRTASMDNPQLNVRLVEGRNPKKIVFDTDLSLPLTINTFRDSERDKTFVCCNQRAIGTRKAETLRLAGIQLIPVEIGENGKLNITSALYALAEKNIASVLVEGGSSIYSSFIESQMVDELHFFIAPKIIGRGLRSFEKYSVDYLNEALNLEIKAISKSGTDVHVIAVKK